MMRFRPAILWPLLAVLLALTANPVAAQLRGGDLSYRDSPSYKQELQGYLDAGGTDIQRFDQYYQAYIAPRERTAYKALSDLADLPKDLADVFLKSLKERLNK